MEEIVVHSTRDQIMDFKDSLLWGDIVRELESWKMGFNIEMLSIVDDAANENPSTASLMLHMGDLNGRQKAVDYMLSLPDVLLTVLEDKLIDKELEKEISDE